MAGAAFTAADGMDVDPGAEVSAAASGPHSRRVKCSAADSSSVLDGTAMAAGAPPAVICTPPCRESDSASLGPEGSIGATADGGQQPHLQAALSLAAGAAARSAVAAAVARLAQWEPANLRFHAGFPAAAAAAAAAATTVGAAAVPRRFPSSAAPTAAAAGEAAGAACVGTAVATAGAQQQGLGSLEGDAGRAAGGAADGPFTSEAACASAAAADDDNTISKTGSQQKLIMFDIAACESLPCADPRDLAAALAALYSRLRDGGELFVRVLLCNRRLEPGLTVAELEAVGVLPAPYYYEDFITALRAAGFAQPRLVKIEPWDIAEQVEDDGMLYRLMYSRLSVFTIRAQRNSLLDAHGCEDYGFWVVYKGTLREPPPAPKPPPQNPNQPQQQEQQGAAIRGATAAGPGDVRSSPAGGGDGGRQSVKSGEAAAAGGGGRRPSDQGPHAAAAGGKGSAAATAGKGGGGSSGGGKGSSKGGGRSAAAGGDGDGSSSSSSSSVEECYALDLFHSFPRNSPVMVCANTAAMLGEQGVSWLSPHFVVAGDRSCHMGTFSGRSLGPQHQDRCCL
ncbi:hypothetical protein HXX76_009974 [Chlamydomonas incerta]|uniref:Uncharacterized protein n=1 Tax=Chlamydomonas incerta TaxID=51695 RepID=A0A835VZ84_CHLIN|nr:hypothetical protein HXX76_009974 [Chlamydomonas incerta]|eukprot:KAG2430451.1 hypothetical protein HXX76_009974 [Chlamydomonas incerta]